MHLNKVMCERIYLKLYKTVRSEEGCNNEASMFVTHTHTTKTMNLSTAQLLKQTNKYTHTAYNYMFVSVSPLHVSAVKPPPSGGTKDHRLRSASKAIQYFL
jgi:ribulose-5-phosphate 4-epimerase/fuculose-1-phosphate aldolase